MHCGLAAQRAERVKDKHGYVCIKLLTVLGHAKVAAVHGTRGCAQAAAAGVLKTLTGLEQRLLAHYAKSFDFVVAAIRVVNAPSARYQLRWHAARVGNSDRVREGVHALVGRRLVCQIRGLYLNAKLILRHSDMVAVYDRVRVNLLSDMAS
jgi:hypothetical protein